MFGEHFSSAGNEKVIIFLTDEKDLQQSQPGVELIAKEDNVYAYSFTWLPY